MENELSRVVDALPGLVWTALPDGDLDFVNQRWCDYTGLAAEEARGAGWQAVVHPEDLAEALARWHSILSSGDAGEMEARLRRFDGAYHWFICRACPIADAAGNVIKWCGINSDLEGRWQAEDARRAQWWLPSPTRESHFRSIADSIPALVCLMKPSGELDLVNRGTLEYFGTTAEELKRRPMAETMHSDDVANAVAVSQGPKSVAGEPFSYEKRLRRFDGVYRWFRTHAFPLRDTKGQVVLWYMLQTDIDDRKRAEVMLAGEKHVLELVASGEPLSRILKALCLLFEETIDACVCNILLIDADGRKFLNGAATGLSSGYTQAFDGRVIDPASEPCSLALTSKAPVVVSDVPADPRWSRSAWPRLMADIAMRSSWSNPILSGDQSTLGVVAVYRRSPGSPTAAEQDLIERMTQIASIAIARERKESALKRSEAFLKEAQRLSSTGGFSWNAASNEITWSDEVYRIFEIEPGGPLTPAVTDMRVHPDDLPLVYEKVNRARMDGKDFGFDYRIVMPDGSIKHLYTVFHRTQDLDGGIEFVGAIQDVTERRRSEDALGELRTELTRVARITSLGALTASIAHEVNQPLSGIVTNANTSLRMLAADPPNITGARETARRTIRDANRAAEVITRLRALFTKKAATSEPVDLNDAAQEVIALSLGELQRNRVSVRTEFAAGLAPVTGDRVQLQQVILNLILNASDAMSRLEDRARQLVVRTEPDGKGGVRLAVQDSGIGFDRDQAEKLFNAFYTTKSGGMGIGLSVSRTIVENHQGRLWAETNDGPGATFLFSIPCGVREAMDAEIALARPLPRPPTPAQRENIVSNQ
jgi:PAS domain S-box-containing protein